MYMYMAGKRDVSIAELHTKKIADELARMKSKIAKVTIKKETEIMDYINRSFDYFLMEMKELEYTSYDGKGLEINVGVLHKKNDELKGRVIGCIGNVMDRRLVQTDKTLSVILENRDDKERKKNVEAFAEQVRKQAIGNFKKKIEQEINEQSEIVADEINMRLNEVNKDMEESINVLTAIMETERSNGTELEKMKIQYMYEHSLYALLLNEAES